MSESRWLKGVRETGRNLVLARFHLVACKRHLAMLETLRDWRVTPSQLLHSRPLKSCRR